MVTTDSSQVVVVGSGGDVELLLSVCVILEIEEAGVYDHDSDGY